MPKDPPVPSNMIARPIMPTWHATEVTHSAQLLRSHFEPTKVHACAAHGGHAAPQVLSTSPTCTCCVCGPRGRRRPPWRAAAAAVVPADHLLSTAWVAIWRPSGAATLALRNAATAIAERRTVDSRLSGDDISCEACICARAFSTAHAFRQRKMNAHRVHGKLSRDAIIY